MAACTSGAATSPLSINGPIMVSFAQASSCCMKPFFRSDINLSPSASVNSLAVGSLPCSLQAESSPRVPCRVNGRSPRRNPPVAGYPGECLDTAGWRLQWKDCEQGKAAHGGFHGTFQAGGGDGGSRPEGPKLNAFGLGG